MRRLLAILFAVGALLAAGAQNAGATKVFPPTGNCSVGAFITAGDGSVSTFHSCNH